MTCSCSYTQALRYITPSGLIHNQNCMSHETPEARRASMFAYLYDQTDDDRDWYKRVIWHAINNLTECGLSQKELKAETKKRIKDYQTYFNEVFPTSEVDFKRVFC